MQTNIQCQRAEQWLGTTENGEDGPQGNFGDDGSIPYLDHGDSFRGEYMYQNSLNGKLKM